MTHITQHQLDAMDETAEWSARAHPLPHPQPSHLRVVREPIPTMPFAPGVIEHHERRKSTRRLFAILGASACLVMCVAWRWLR